MAAQDLVTITKCIRSDIIHMIASAGSGHPGGSLSCADVLSALFFSGVMEYDHDKPTARTGDRFFLSKGHAAPALYAVYHQLGWVDDEELARFRSLGSRLQGHPDAKFLGPVEICSGSLGQGLAVGCGVAIAQKRLSSLEGTVPQRTYVLCGDGELQEGSNWEAIMLASHRSLDNLTLLVDLNGLQIDGATNDICSLGNLGMRFDSFGWRVHCIDGHCIKGIIDALVWASRTKGAPQAIICKTVKGKGVGFMENQVDWHGRAPSLELARAALENLGKTD